MKLYISFRMFWIVSAPFFLFYPSDFILHVCLVSSSIIYVQYYFHLSRDTLSWIVQMYPSLPL
jgi:hypothetical protein